MAEPPKQQSTAPKAARVRAGASASGASAGAGGTSARAPAARKKPGRPRKCADVCQVGVHGIVTEPANTCDCIELIYNQPMLFKCIMAIFKEYDSDDIIFEFSPSRVLILGRDHSARVIIHIVINAADMNLYYFSQPAYAGSDAIRPSSSIAGAAAGVVEPMHCVAIKRDNLEVVASIVEKMHYRIALTLRKDDPSSLYITLSSHEYDNEDQFEVSIIPHVDDIPHDVVDTSTYPLEFTLDARHLRQKIREFKKVSPDIVIKKAGDGDLEISFGAQSRVVYTGIYKAGSRIKLRSEIAQGSLFVVTMGIGRIRPLVAVNVPGGVTFFANQSNTMVVQVGLDMRMGDAAIIANASERAGSASGDGTDSDSDPTPAIAPDAHYAIIARLMIDTSH